MAETEKITINLGPVDLGKIDLLVEQGIYSNRTDLIRTGIRNQIEKHEATITDVIVRKHWVLGVEHITRTGLEKRRAAGEQLSLRIIGMLSIASDVDPELAMETIRTVAVHGAFRAPETVKKALLEREEARGDDDF